MKVIIKGKNAVDLNDTKDFIAEGGEGRIYEKNGVIFKIYFDQKKVIPYEKIVELSLLNLKNIVRPIDLLLNQKNDPVGFTMNFINNTSPLCKLFTNEFRNNNNITDEIIVKLVEKMQEVTCFIHDKGGLIVDGNEMNYLVDKMTFTEPYFIDVDSYQTKNFPATALMPSIKDWHTKGFNILTDWFAFAIVSCQLFVGIHPYKGNHQVKSMEERMKSNISIFNKDVRLPKTVRDFSHIPVEFMTWYERLFEKGERIPPPKVSGLLNVVAVKVKVIQSTNNFEISFIKDFPDEIISVKSIFGTLYVKTKKEVYVGNAGYPIQNPSTGMISTQDGMRSLLYNIKDGKLLFKDVISKETIDPEISCDNTMVVSNTLYAISNGKVRELDITYINNKIMIFVKSQYDIMPKSSVIFDGFIYQNILGKAYITIPVPTDSHSLSCMYEVNLKELEGYKVISGKCENRICSIVGSKNGLYYRFLLKFKDDYSRYEVIECKEVHLGNNNNFICLKNGVCVSIDEEDDVNVFFNKYDQKGMTKIQDPDIDSSMSLGNDGMKVLFYQGKSLYSLEMRKKS